jgi:hypothetical protein
MRKRALTPTLLLALAAGCAEGPTVYHAGPESDGSGLEVDLSAATHGIYLYHEERFDADGDGSHESMLKYIQLMASTEPDLCSKLNGQGWFSELTLGYSLAAKIAPLDEQLGDFILGEEIFGDYQSGTWVDQGVMVIQDGRLMLSTAGIGDGQFRLSRVSAINDIGEPLKAAIQRASLDEGGRAAAINDIGEPIFDIGEPMAAGGSGMTYFDFSGRSAYDYDYDGDGVKEATRIAPTPISFAVTGAEYCATAP